MLCSHSIFPSANRPPERGSVLGRFRKLRDTTNPEAARSFGKAAYRARQVDGDQADVIGIGPEVGTKRSTSWPPKAAPRLAAWLRRSSSATEDAGGPHPGSGPDLILGRDLTSSWVGT